MADTVPEHENIIPISKIVVNIRFNLFFPQSNQPYA